MAIESMIAQRGKVPSYLGIGDSITEYADFPTICGHHPINAGIVGATTATFKDEAVVSLTRIIGGIHRSSAEW
jgi:hypothetical protein